MKKTVKNRQSREIYAKAMEALRTGQEQKGIALLREALASAPEAGDIHYTLGTVLSQAGNTFAAKAHLAEAVRLLPGNRKIMEAYAQIARTAPTAGGALLAGSPFVSTPVLPLPLDRPSPNTAELQMQKGRFLKGDPARHDEALACFRDASHLEPTRQEAWLELATMLELLNRVDEAAEVLRQAKTHCKPWGFSAIEITLARRCGANPADAIAVLEPRLKNVSDAKLEHTKVFSEMGMLYDLAGMPAKAFACFKKSNNCMLASGEVRRIDRDYYPSLIARSLRCAREENFGKWPMYKSAAGERADPVFLVGFPRSGTTLLEQILASHPAIAASEEHPCIQEVMEVMEKRLHVRYPESISDLSDRDIAALRAEFFRLHESFGLNTGKDVVVDKYPLNLIHADIIHRLFPRAKFILALRHPCDCVLSCFMQSFAPNEAMIQFLGLESAGAFYDRVFALWEEFRARLPLNVHVIRYEDIVADFRPAVEALLSFLGVEWTDSVLAYDKAAQQRGRIRTPSYSQVTQQIYTRASGRWLRYRKQMVPVLDLLEPWVGKYGYAMR